MARLCSLTTKETNTDVPRKGVAHKQTDADGLRGPDQTTDILKDKEEVENLHI